MLLFSMLPSTLKYLYSVELVRMHFSVYQWYWVQCCFFSMLPSILKYLFSVEPVRMHFPAKQPCKNDTVCNAAYHSCYAALHTVSFVHGCIAGKMHSDWFNGIKILQGRWQHGEKVGYCYPSGLEKTLCKWDIYVPLVTKGLTLRLLMSYIYGAPILDVSRSHTTTHHSR